VSRRDLITVSIENGHYEVHDYVKNESYVAVKAKPNEENLNGLDVIRIVSMLLNRYERKIT
jgi:hypothetical protein